MKRMSVGVVVVLVGALPGTALADHPGDISELTPAVERVLGEDTTQAPSGVLKVPLDDGAVLRTHGPDASADAADPLAVAGPSDRFLPGSAERPPLCATDYALQILYARSPSAPDRLATVAPQLRSVVERSNHVLNEDAIASGGGGGDYKVTCSGGDIDVRSFTTSATSFGQVVDAARAAGFTSSARDYVIFLDASVSGYCGVGSLYFSDGPSLSNPHNTNGGYSVVYRVAGRARRSCTRSGTTAARFSRRLPTRPGRGRTATRATTSCVTRRTAVTRTSRWSTRARR